jgi:acyl carrier protein
VPDDLTQDVIAIIAREQRIPVESIKPDATFEELKIDSLDGVNIVFALEERFNLSIPDDVAKEMKSIQQVVDALRQQLENGSSSDAASQESAATGSSAPLPEKS